MELLKRINESLKILDPRDVINLSYDIQHINFFTGVFIPQQILKWNRR